MSLWKTFGIEEKVRLILTNVKDDSPKHHFGCSFITAYQLSIEFEQLFPNEVKQLDLEVGGRGVGQHTSLAQYLARQLSQRIKSGEIKDVEGSFISNRKLKDIVFKYDPPIYSSVIDDRYGTSMYRLKE